MATPFHEFQNRPARVLIWNIEIFAKALLFGNQPHEFVRDHIRVAVEEPHPLQAIDLDQLAEQCRETVSQAEVLAISHGVLRNDYQLANTLLRKTARFRHKIRDAAAPEPAAETRNCAERAHMVAAFGDFQIRHVRGCREDSRDRRNFLR